MKHGGEESERENGFQVGIIGVRLWIATIVQETLKNKIGIFLIEEN